jgi:hypothetical protein
VTARRGHFQRALRQCLTAHIAEIRGFTGSCSKLRDRRLDRLKPRRLVQERHHFGQML